MPRPATRHRPARARRWLLGTIGAVVVLALLAPTILSLTPIPGQLVASQLPAEAGRLSTGATSLSWTGPVAISGVEFRNPQGEVLASVERVQLAGGVLGLVAGGAAPLEVRVERPRVDVAVSPEGTNFDALIRAIESKQHSAPAVVAPQPAAAPNARRPLKVTVVGGAARVTSTVSGQQWLVDEVGVDLYDPALGIDAIHFSASGKVGGLAADRSPAPQPGVFEVRLGEAEQGGRLATVKADHLPLGLVEPFLKSADPTATLAGWASVEGDAAWRPAADASRGNRPADVLRALAAGGVRSAGALRLSGIEFSGAATQGGPVHLASIDGPWRLAAAGDGVEIQQLDFASEVGRVSAKGVISVPEVERWQARVPIAPRNLEVAARVDLDRLAAVAPQLVRLQQGARVESGRVEATATCRDGRVDCRLATGALTGIAGGRRIAWREPLDVRLVAAQRTPAGGLAGWMLESLKATSTFVQANASGDASRLTGNVRFDLDRLAQELAPIVDLGQTRLAGTGSADVAVERDESTGFWRLDSDGEVDGLFVGAADAPIAREPKLVFAAHVRGSLDGRRAPAGTVELTAGEDTLRATLPEANGSGSQPFEVLLAGDAARWWRRAMVATPSAPRPEDLQVAGRVELTAKGFTGPEGGTLDQFNAALIGLSLDTAAFGPSAPRLLLRNERIEVSGRAAWDLQEQTVRVGVGQFVSSVASANVRDVFVSRANPASSRGESVFRVDLARLNNWTPPRDGPAKYAAGGMVEGSARLRGVPEGTQVLLKATGKQLALTDRTPASGAPRPVWQEPQLTLSADAMVIPLAGPDGKVATYSVDIRDALVEARSLSGSFGGRIADVVAAQGVEVGGGVNYDLEQLTPILWPQLGDSVRLVGRDRATFRVATDEAAPAGAPPIARLRARVEAPWESASLFGLPVGAGRLAATLERGVARFDPLDVAIGGGRLTAAATAALHPEPASLSLAPGPLLTDVAVSQEVNERVLKFIAPVLADATRIDGRFSLSLRELALPLAPPPTSGPRPGRAAGVLDVRQLRVLPGPSVAEWVAIVRQIEGLARDGVKSAVSPRETVLVAIENNQIDFQLVDSRVYHRGLRFAVGDATVQSSGSVGLDETLDIVLAVPILDEWVNKEPVLLGRLRGQALQIPIQGTFSKPKVNSDAFRDLSGRVIEGAAAGALEEGFNLLLDKLRSR